MYLLQTVGANELGIIVLGLIISYVILYNIITSAIRATNKETKEQLFVLIQLKLAEMKKQGFTHDEVNDILDNALAPKKK